ncbi:MAG: GNAT family N-acetyltransferase [Pyrinomonadaceae bacterium]|nr:GNAT family N-acetyltransferase [Pyrinomonadaceae bacterium]
MPPEGGTLNAYPRSISSQLRVLGLRLNFSKMIYSDKTLSQKLERAEATANADFIEARRASNPASDAEWIEVGGAYAMFDGVRSPLTQTFGLGLFDEITHKHLDTLEAFFKEKGAEVFHEVSPLADASLLNLLNERGYQPIEMTSVMFQEINDEMIAALQVNPQINTRITGKGEEKLWAKTSANGWATEMEGLADFMFEFGQVSAACKNGLPFIAEFENEPIAAGMLFTAGEVALLAGASTVPEGRRKGAQLALLNARLKFAAEKGCQIAMMGAMPGSQSQKNAEKKGFRIAYTRTKWKLG